MKRILHPGLLALSALPTLLVACGGSDSALPQLTAASAGTLLSCTDLASKISFPNTTITAANAIAAGTLTVAGTPVPAHCQITGKMNPRVSAVDGNNYAIGFEMRLPYAWNGRFFYQGNGGTDGSVVTATGGVNGGSGPTNALNMGFAVISSDAGHSTPGANFGIDPQARLDYGYQAAATLTPMAKSAIKTAYGKGPDRSYFGGCSNGGRHTMVAATREPEEYDGYLVGDPGFRLPLAATANIAGAQAYATVATSSADLSTGFTTTERALVSNAVLAKCDALDGATDGMVQNTAACQAAFNLDRDVPTCSGARDGSCLSAAQKTVVAKLFSGATNSSGSKFYSNWPFDAGLATAGWASWKFTSPAQRDAGAVGLIWQVPPEAASTFNGTTFSLTGSIDDMLAKIAATNSTYTESALSFMLPVNPSNLSRLRDRGAKMMVYHGTSDPIFSSNDTTTWYESLRAANGGNASNFARYYPVPGMNHCSGGPTADQFDMLTPLVNWVEKGQAPDSVVANARGPGNAVAVNADVPSSWSPSRSRPLCAYPKVATYNGSGDVESAASFSCK
ncbi:MAG: tannase/feruloyl esterase family alpha/beta hydrolase [Rhodoferax sp.]|uniref:tannase/feruloyl esterase family alpha/beta hydrolase n=1 Tax=Rhodoferax sp. TaxID=50421 RepID=UPI0032672948